MGSAVRAAMNANLACAVCLALAVAALHCGEDSVSSTSPGSSADDAGMGASSSGVDASSIRDDDAASASDAAANTDADPDSGVAPIPFTKKATCSPAADLVGVRAGQSIDSGPEGRGVFRAHSDAEPVRGFAFFSPNAEPCEIGLWNGTSFGLSTLPGTGRCNDIMAFGDSKGALAFSVMSPVGSSSPTTAILARRVGAAWTPIATIANAQASRAALVVAKSGHGVLMYGVGQDLHLALVAPGATSSVELPIIVSGNANDPMQATIDDVGAGFVVWRNGSGAPFVRAFVGGAWVAGDVALGNELRTASLVSVPGGAYVAGPTNGRSVALVGGAVSVGALEPTNGVGTAPGRLAASPGGDLTLLYRKDTADPFEKMVTASRRLAGTTWTAPVDLGLVPNSAGMEIPVTDAGGHVTVARTRGGTVFHHRIARGATVWEPAITVGTGAASFALVSAGIDTQKADPIITWSVGSKIVYARCN